VSESITIRLQALRTMTVAELRVKHLELFGIETQSRHKDQLFKRLAWRIQELEFGGLSERAKRRAEEIANDLDARFLPPRKPQNRGGKPHELMVTRVRPEGGRPAAGTILRREYHGEIHEVTVLERGFEYEGKGYRSLSGIARAITGTHWNGHLFFGLRSRGASNAR
jgi:hypothetical protein